MDEWYGLSDFAIHHLRNERRTCFPLYFPLRLFLSPTCFLGPFVFFLQQSRKIWMMDGWSSAPDNVLDMDLQTAGNEEKCQTFFSLAELQGLGCRVYLLTKPLTYLLILDGHIPCSQSYFHVKKRLFSSSFFCLSPIRGLIDGMK